MPAVDDPTLAPPEQPAAPSAAAPTTSRPRGGLFRAFWRWHFYASFLVIPVVLVLAVTGLVYLFRFQLEPALHPELMRVEAPPEGAQLAGFEPYRIGVAATYPDATVVSMTEPATETDPLRFSLETADGTPLDVFVDPWTGKILGDLNPDTTVSGTAVRLHADLMAGDVGDAVLELGACWAIVMALSGYYLFWRGRQARARKRRSGTGQARLRTTHAWTGAFVGAGLLLLVVSGLPWTGIWGENVQALATRSGTSLWSQDHGALSDPVSTLDESLPHSHEVPWAQGKSPVPTSDPDAVTRSVATVDTALLLAAQEGLAHPMTVALPREETGVLTVIGYAFDDPGEERSVHVDRFGGTVVSQYGYDDYPALAKTVAQGIALHEGRRFGTLNMVLTAAFCLAVVVMCVTGPVMWWRRRPRGQGRVGAPRGRLPVRTTPLLAVGLVVLGVTLPLFGASLVVILLLDRFVLRRLPATRQFFDVA